MSCLVTQKQNVVNKLVNCDQNLVNHYLDILWQSDFLVESFSRFPNWLVDIHNNPPSPTDYQNYATWLKQLITTVSSEEQLMSVLRQFRRKMLV